MDCNTVVECLLQDMSVVPPVVHNILPSILKYTVCCACLCSSRGMVVVHILLPAVPKLLVLGQHAGLTIPVGSANDCSDAVCGQVGTARVFCGHVHIPRSVVLRHSLPDCQDVSKLSSTPGGGAPVLHVTVIST